MPNESRLWLPSHLRPARKATRVVFYKWRIAPDRYRYTVGMPEQYPAPKGAEKIVCESAADVDKYDKILREQDKFEHEMTEAQREEFEGPIRAHLRAELHHRMVNSKNAINREFCRLAIQKMDEYEAQQKEKRESFQHIVGYEEGK